VVIHRAAARRRPHLVLMALIAVYAVVDIPADVRVMEIGRVSAPMANGALEDRVVRGINVACGAHAIGPAVIHGEIRMVECCPGPGRRGVAGRTSCRESGRRMSRIGCRIVRSRVATVAIYRQRREVVVHVAARARDRRGVITSQRESRRAVIKRRRLPHRSCMAERTVRREPNLSVIRSRRALVVREVAGHTSGHGQAVVVVYMAARASDRRMKTS